jgi:hypothetical protein
MKMSSNKLHVVISTTIKEKKLIPIFWTLHRFSTCNGKLEFIFIE